MQLPPQSFFLKEGTLINSPFAEQQAPKRSSVHARSSPILIVVSMIIAHGPVPLSRVVLVLQRTTIRPSWWVCGIGTSISWSSAFENPGSSSQQQSSISSISDSSSAAADAATAAPADWPTVSADPMVELPLSLLKTTAPAGVKCPHADLLAGGTPKAARRHHSIRRRGRRPRRPAGTYSPGRGVGEGPS
jgi:hypothetical protein